MVATLALWSLSLAAQPVPAPSMAAANPEPTAAVEDPAAHMQAQSAPIAAAEPDTSKVLRPSALVLRRLTSPAKTMSTPTDSGGRGTLRRARLDLADGGVCLGFDVIGNRRAASVDLVVASRAAALKFRF